MKADVLTISCAGALVVRAILARLVFILSLDDDLMKRFAGPRLSNAMRAMGLKDGIPIESRMVTRSVEKAQKRVEEYHYGVRKTFLNMIRL